MRIGLVASPFIPFLLLVMAEQSCLLRILRRASDA